jgi:E3 ubiquitin-protein ligase MUL1
MQVFAWCFGALGAAMVVRKALRQWLKQRRQQQARKRALVAMKESAEREAAAKRAAGGGEGGLGDELEGGGAGDAAGGVCVVCMEQPANMVFVNCGHMCSCIGCALKLKRPLCPVCRTRGDAIRVFKP